MLRAKTRNKSRNNYRKEMNKENLPLTLMAIPFVIYIIMFRYVPLFGWSFAFTNYKPGLSIFSLKFEGFKYFRFISVLWKDVANALLNTIVMSGLSLLTMVFPILFALLLNEVASFRIKKLIQTTVTLPHFVSWVIVYALCFSLFSTNGMVNRALSMLGSDGTVNILGNKDAAWLFMTVLGLWKELGWSSIVYLAAIASVDPELYDAAKVDGAGRFAVAIHVTLPGLAATFIVLLLLKIGNLLNVGFEKYLMFTNTITTSKLEVLDIFTYRIGIGTQQYSFATAVSILKSVVSVVLISLANMLAKKVRGETII